VSRQLVKCISVEALEDISHISVDNNVGTGRSKDLIKGFMAKKKVCG